jgi:uncharacterized protein YdhG (YjbR/CyaY superfamily)
MEEKKAPPATVDEYIAQYPEELRQILAKIRAVIREAAPEAEEKISYGMPGFFQNGGLIYFAVNKRHIGLYPKTKAVARIEEVAGYQGTKSSIHLPLDQPIPYELIRKIVKARLSENMTK